jgi:electron transport complex protein RnfD
MTGPRLNLSASPHLHTPDSTTKIMWNVVFALLPLVAASGYFFGISALLVVAAATLTTVATERLISGKDPIRDGSATITGILLGLVLPAGMPLWMVVIGGVAAIGIGKSIFGGLGQNVFNPALVGRAFLQAAFPQAITTWPTIGGSFFALKGDSFALPLMSAQAPDVVTQATPLGLMKFEHAATDAGALFIGNVGGSLGETSALLILLCGAYLAWRSYLNWRIPASILLTTAVFAGVLHAINPEYPSAVFMLLSGGLMLGAVFMATDMVTSPITHRGCWIFGVGIGLLVVLIRVWGGLPEGVMYAILIMNSLVPFINKATQPRVFGVPAPSRVGRKAVAS